MRLLLLLAVVPGIAWAKYNPCVDPQPGFVSGTFPAGFKWAAATAAYQIEGGWNASGRGVSIWDTWCHQQNDPVANHGSGDVACDSFHKWMADIGLLKQLGLKWYRFSISWPRLVPTGFVNERVNMAGYMYYRTLIQTLLQNGIQPMVTMYHWDLPQPMQDQGGWMNDNSIQWFTDYADLLFRLYGDLVQYWITFNEPWTFLVLGYGNGAFAPGVGSCVGTCPYIGAHNIIRAHAKVYRLYQQKYAAAQNGKLGMALNTGFAIPNTQSYNDSAASNRSMNFGFGWFAHPLFVNGDYPAVMRQVVDSRSKAEGRITSRLPYFTAAEKAMIKGSADFLGLNYYTSTVTYNAPNDPTQQKPPSYFSDQQVGSYACGNWRSSGSSWLKAVPWGFRYLLNWIRSEYSNPPVIITENGWSDKTGTLRDSGRVLFYKNYINSVLKAVNDGCNVVGYTAWSLMDNFEWNAGYTEKFGITYVNFSDPNRPRFLKDSAWYYASIAANNGFTSNSTTVTPPASTPSSQASTAVPRCGCGQTNRSIAAGATAVLTSPNYPNNYCSNENCNWLLSVPAPYKIAISFTAFNTEIGLDMLSVYNGWSSTAALLEAALVDEGSFSCTGSACPSVTSKGNTVRLQFTSDFATNAPGFSATWKAVM